MLAVVFHHLTNTNVEHLQCKDSETGWPALDLSSVTFSVPSCSWQLFWFVKDRDQLLDTIWYPSLTHMQNKSSHSPKKGQTVITALHTQFIVDQRRLLTNRYICLYQQLKAVCHGPVWQSIQHNNLLCLDMARIASYRRNTKVYILAMVDNSQVPRTFPYLKYISHRYQQWTKSSVGRWTLKTALERMHRIGKVVRLIWPRIGGRETRAVKSNFPSCTDYFRFRTIHTLQQTTQRQAILEEQYPDNTRQMYMIMKCSNCIHGIGGTSSCRLCRNVALRLCGSLANPSQKNTMPHGKLFWTIHVITFGFCMSGRPVI